MFDPLPWRDLWRLLNASREIDTVALRAACLALLVFYIGSALARPTDDAAISAVRFVTGLYIALGALLASRINWRGLRAYTVGLALVLTGATAAIVALRGNQGNEIALLALALFGPTVFLQTAIDVIVVTVVLGLGAGAFLVVFPPAALTVNVAAIVLGGALIAGAITALVMITFRGRISESTRWWQEACARERTLREFAEQAAPHLGENVLSRELATRFRGAFGAGHCGLVLVDGEGVAYVAATAGAPPGPAPSVADLAVLIRALASREVLTTPPLGVHAWQAPGGAWVALPVPIDAALGGAVVLSAAGPRPITREEPLLWRAMAVQVGVALGSARLFARLQEALRARGEFVDTMSHELRSPLHVILGYTDMLGDGRADVDFAAGRIRAASLELLQLVENTMTAARFGSGKLSVQVSEFDLAALLDEVRETAAALPYVSGDVALRWEVAADLPPVRLDRLKVKEVVHNLVANGLKFTARGSVTVRAARERDMIRIEVEDTGSGIPDDVQVRIFEMFERFEPAGAARPSGVGLGLYIVRSLVALMSGTVAVYSAAGQGARFTVRLPIRLAAG